MKNYLTLGILTAVAASSLAFVPANADEWRDARRNEVHADRQEMKAQRDAAFGNYYGASRHAEHAQRDAYRANRDQRRAWRNTF